MFISCEANEEQYWQRIDFILQIVYGGMKMPDDVYAPCDDCGTMGFRWLIRSVRLCAVCYRRRLAAADRASRLATAEAESSKPPEPS